MSGGAGPGEGRWLRIYGPTVGASPKSDKELLGWRRIDEDGSSFLQGSPFLVCLFSSKILCWGSLRPVALALGKMQGWDRSLCLPFPPQASATPWPLSLKYFTVWTFSPLTLRKTYETAEVLRACITRPSSHSWIRDSDHIPSSSSLLAAAALKGTFTGTKRLPGFTSVSVPESQGRGGRGNCQKSYVRVILKEGTVSLTFQRKNPSQEQSQAPGWTTARSSGWRKIQSPFQGSCEMQQWLKFLRALPLALRCSCAQGSTQEARSTVTAQPLCTLGLSGKGAEMSPGNVNRVYQRYLGGETKITHHTFLR